MRKRLRAGSNIVEAALVLLVFLAVLIAIADFALVFYYHQTLVARTANAARYGATVYPVDRSGIANLVVYGAAAPSGTTAPVLAGMTTQMVSATQSGTIGCPDARLTVRVSGYSFSFLTPWIAGTKSGQPITASLPYEAPPPAGTASPTCP